MIDPAPSLADQIKAHLVEQIANGTLEPGDRLIELKIAKELGTSQAPVREALRALEASGLIAFRRNRGAVVRKVDRTEIIEIYAVRAELEGFAITQMAGSSAALSLSKLCDQMEAAVAKSDLALFAELNARFHRSIVEAASNETLLRLWETLDVQTRSVANMRNDASNLPKAVSQHREIVAAVESGDGDRARKLLVQHINSSVL